MIKINLLPKKKKQNRDKTKDALRLMLLVFVFALAGFFIMENKSTPPPPVDKESSKETSTDSSLTWKEDPFESETPLKTIDLEHAVQIIDIMIDGHQVYFIKLNGHVYFIFGDNGRTPIHIPDCPRCS